MDRLTDILCPMLQTITGDILYNISGEKSDIVCMDILNRLDLLIRVVTSTYL